MFCGNIMLRYGYPHDKDHLLLHLSALPQWQLDQFCVEILALEDFYQRSVGQWATDMPWVFKPKGGEKFYRIRIRKKINVLMDVPYWKEIKEARDNGQFSNILLKKSIGGLDIKQYAEFCTIILKLEHHYAFAHNLSFMRSSDGFELKDPGKQKNSFMFKLTGIERNASVHYRRLITKTNENETNKSIEFE